MDRQIPLLILGLGNLLCADDGVGSFAVKILRDKYEWPKGVEILDGGTLGLSLLPYLQDAEAAILIDAIRTEDPPGTLQRLVQQDVLPMVLHRLSPHQIGVADLLVAAGLLDQTPDRLVLIGLVAETIELRVGLSPAVEQNMASLIEAVRAEARELGWEIKPRVRAA